MRKVLPQVSVSIALLTGYVAPCSAHHSFSMYDMSATLTVQGEVTQFVWQAPHTHIHIKVAAVTGKPGSGGDYDIEGPAPNILARQGWNKLTVKAGDRVSLTAHPMRANARAGALVYAVVNGEVKYADAKRPEVPASAIPAKPPAP